MFKTYFANLKVGTRLILLKYVLKQYVDLNIVGLKMNIEMIV